ncbi:MAG: FecR family protein [Dissulfuribacterales bacterium]
MGQKRKDKLTDEYLEQAAQWFARSRAGDFSKDERDQFDEWLKADVSHGAAFKEIEETWQEVGFLPSPSSLPDRHVASKRYRLFPCPGFQLAGLAAMILLVSSILFFRPEIMNYWTLIMGKEITYRTEIGKTQKITLKDGSKLEMNGDSCLTVRYGKSQRKVDLSEGEVFFHVAYDPQRPFQIKSHRGMVRVLGTAFHVRSRNGKVAVDVEDGRVQVTTDPERNSGILTKGVIIKGGEGVDYNWSGRINTKRVARLDEVSAWRQGKIVFRSMRLSKVLQELEHYHRIRLELPDEKLWNSHFTGTFDSHNLDEILGAIKVSFSLSSEIRPDGTVVLMSKK